MSNRSPSVGDRIKISLPGELLWGIVVKQISLIRLLAKLDNEPVVNMESLGSHIVCEWDEEYGQWIGVVENMKVRLNPETFEPEAQFKGDDEWHKLEPKK